MSQETEEEVSCCPPGSMGAPSPSLFTEDPDGEFITIDKNNTNTPCYLTSFPKNSSNNKAMVLFPDVWGMKSRIVKIADWIAKEANCCVLVIDFFRGETKDDHADNMKKWFESVPYQPTIENDVSVAIDYLKKERGVTSFGAMGFCWGGWAIAKTCQVGNIDWRLVISPHPSFKVEPWVFSGNDVTLMQSMTCPVLLMPASNDPRYTKPDSPEFQAMPNKSSKSIPFEDMQHGWTTRGDVMTDPTMKRDVEAALQETLKFVKIYL
jgi:dienelactone hydrolase